VFAGVAAATIANPKGDAAGAVEEVKDGELGLVLEHKNRRYTRVLVKLMRGGKRTRGKSPAFSHRK
jgi:hypothetical protein